MGNYLEWQYIVFWAPGLVGVLLGVGLAFGLGDDAGGQHEHDIDHGVGGKDFGKEIGKEVGKEHGKETGKGHPTTLGASGDELGWHPVAQFTDYLGFGRVPFTIIVTTLLLSWAIIGFLGNKLLAPLLVTPMLYGFISMAVAFVGGTYVTGKLGRLLHKHMPANESYTVSKHSLVGSVGTIVVPTDGDSGMVQVTDSNNHPHEIPCRSKGEAVPDGKKVLVLEYEESEGRYLVEPYADETDRVA